MKIGIVTQSYYPRYGGVTEHVHNTAIELRRRGHEVLIITSRFRGGESNHAVPVERIGYNILVPFNRAFVDLTVGMNLRRQLRNLLRASDLDVLHTHCPPAPTLPIMAIQAASCAQVGTFHTTSGRTLLQDTFHPYLSKVVAKLDARIAVSRTAEASAQRYYPGHYHLIPNGVDVERFHPEVEPFEDWRDPERITLLFVGRLDPRKGLQVLLAAMPQVIERTGGRARLVVVGDSYLRAKFESSLAPWVRPHVHFRGHVPSADLPRWYATGDLFVSPASCNESFGIVLLEAMASGRPVVASDIPGYRSVIQHAENGMLVPPGDADALARTLVGLIEDPERRRRLAERGRARSLEYAWPRVTERIEGVYRQVLGKRSTIHPPAWTARRDDDTRDSAGASAMGTRASARGGTPP